MGDMQGAPEGVFMSYKRARATFSLLAFVAGAGAALWAAPTTAKAQEAREGEGGEPETVVVTGRRASEAAVAIGLDETSNTIAITREALLSAPSGVSGLKMLETLPGFNVQANDALGLYEFGNSVTIRAFNFRQIGFVLDGAPMGRSDQFGGSPIFRYVENENLARVTASQGAGDVTLPSYASLGPIVRYSTIDPTLEPGASATFSAGNDNLRRGFVRLETGEHGGLSGYLSVSDFSADLWRGPGDINRDHVEAKIRYRSDTGFAGTLGLTHNDYFDYDAPAISKAQYAGTAGDVFGRSGRKFAYLETVPDLAPTTPGVRYSNANYNQYFKQAINSRTDTLYHLSAEAPLGAALRLEGTLYYEEKEGYGVSPEAYATSLSSYNAQRNSVSGLTAPRGLQYGLSTVEGEREGAVVRGVADIAGHRITAGFWVETDDYHRTQARYNQADGSPDGQPLLNEPVHFQRDFVSTRETTQLFLQDKIALFDDRLTLELGVKALLIDYAISGYRNAADYNNRRQPSLSDSWEDGFLPNVGLVWDMTGTEQIFASYAENMALPQGADDVYSAASPTVTGVEAEKSTNVELGLRTNRATFNAAFAVYRTTFDNRLQSFASLVPGSTTSETFFQNVGEVIAYGGELSGVWKPDFLGRYAYFNANVSYNISEFQDNYTTSTATTSTLVSIAGNSVPDSPEWLLQGGVTVEPLSWLVANVSVRHMSKRFTNFVNTETLDAYSVVNAYVDLGDGFQYGPLENVRLRLNVDNVFDEDYLGTITAATTGLATQLRPGPARTFQVSLTTVF